MAPPLVAAGLPLVARINPSTCDANHTHFL